MINKHVLPRNVSLIKYYCIGCGACEGICKEYAIKIVEKGSKGLKPIVNKDKCNNCGICIKVCPVSSITENEVVINDFEIFRGISQNKYIIDNSSSGGIVSSILISLFNRNIIDAAIVAKYNKNLDVSGDFITGKEDVLKFSGSFYQPSKQLQNIKNISSFSRIAFIGLPCHIEALQNIKSVFGIPNIYITISLFCSIGRLKKGLIDFIKYNYNKKINVSNVIEYSSRKGKERLGPIKIKTKDNDYEISSLQYFINCDYFYIPEGCYNCRKLYGVKADISIGDDWGIKGKEKIAIVKCNSEKGNNVINLVKEELDLKNATLKDLNLSQAIGYLRKVIDPKINKKLKRIKRLRFILFVPKMRDIALKYKRYVIKSIKENYKNIN